MPASSSPRLIGLPYDASSSYLRGPAEAPPLIRAALHSSHWNSWTEQRSQATVAAKIVKEIAGRMLADAGGSRALPTVSGSRR